MKKPRLQRLPVLSLARKGAKGNGSLTGGRIYKMKKSIKRIAISLCSVFVIAAAAGCGGDGGKNKDGKTTIEFWGWGDYIEVDVFKSLVNTFNDAHDDIFVNFTPRPSSTTV